MARFRAPATDGEVLAAPGFEAVPALVEANRRLLDRDDVTLSGLSLRELRALARREALKEAGSQADPVTPLLLAGHQPELAHPGVWVKNFALHGLARKLNATPLNLIIDNDTLKTSALRFPVIDGLKVHLELVPYDRLNGETPYEDRAILDEELFRSFPARAAPMYANWGFEPLLPKMWHMAGNLCQSLTAMRRDREEVWGCRNFELMVSRLSRTVAFSHFAKHILANLARFHDAYNAAIGAYRKANHVRSANHPAPTLAAGEAPFWVHTPSGRRERASAASDAGSLRPRALTLTLFARLCLGDFFIHGIGGGKYDEVTDTIIRLYFGIEPPVYQVLSATLHLPLPAFPAGADDVRRAALRLRELRWNPEKCLSREELARPEMQALVAEKRQLAAGEPPRGDHPARKMWFQELREIKGKLAERVANQLPAAELEAARLRALVDANVILKRRDYSWVLYPETKLRPFLEHFLGL